MASLISIGEVSVGETVRPPAGRNFPYSKPYPKIDKEMLSSKTGEWPPSLNQQKESKERIASLILKLNHLSGRCGLSLTFPDLLCADPCHFFVPFPFRAVGLGLPYWCLCMIKYLVSFTLKQPNIPENNWFSVFHRTINTSAAFQAIKSN